MVAIVKISPDMKFFLEIIAWFQEIISTFATYSDSEHETRR